MTATTGTTAPVKSGAAGAATFAGSDSRKFNYYEPKGRKATHYEDVTLDVQPDPERYLLQDWIINFPDGTPTYSKDWTRCKSGDWHKYRAVDQEWEKTHYQRQSTICGTIQSVIENGRRSGAATRFDKTWVKILQDHLGAYKHAEFGLGTSLMQAQRYGYTQMINNVILTNSSYKLRFAQDLTLYLGEIGLDIEGGIDKDAGKRNWLENPMWQGVRRSIEEIMGSNDYVEQYVAINFVFEPLIGELFRSGFILQMAAASNDFITPSVSRRPKATTSATSRTASSSCTRCSTTARTRCTTASSSASTSTSTHNSHMRPHCSFSRCGRSRASRWRTSQRATTARAIASPRF